MLLVDIYTDIFAKTRKTRQKVPQTRNTTTRVYYTVNCALTFFFIFSFGSV